MWYFMFLFTLFVCGQVFFNECHLLLFVESFSKFLNRKCLITNCFYDLPLFDGFKTHQRFIITCLIYNTNSDITRSGYESQNEYTGLLKRIFYTMTLLYSCSSYDCERQD